MKPILEFNSTESEKITALDGRIFFNSRSTATCIFIGFLFESEIYILLIQRGEDSPDFKYCWAAVSGYLNWGENLNTCVLREVYEEVGLDLKSLESNLIYGSLDFPFYIESDPTAAHQNITMRYVSIFKVDKLPKLYINKGECNDAVLLKVEDLKEKIDTNSLEFAFNHKSLFSEFVNKIFKLK